MSTPYFSILVPTRNRAQLLRQALPTVINQTCDDYEIVVSDNNSEDETREVVEGFMKECSRMRYVNPGESLSMCAHFDYIYQQARGRYLCYVSDDDGIVPSALEISRKAIEQFDIGVLMWSNAGYYHQDIPEGAQRGRMWGRVGTGDLFEIPSELTIGAYMDFEIHALWDVVPKMLKTVVRRDLVEACALKSEGKFHLPPFPDQSASCQLVATNANYHLLDAPLYIAGVSYNSNAGMRYNRKKKYEEYFSLFQEDLLRGVPFVLRYISASYFYAGIQRFQSLYPQKFIGEINAENYLKIALKELLAFQRVEDVSGEMDLLKGYMHEYSGGDELYDRCLETLNRETRLANLNRKILKIGLTSSALMHVLMAGRRFLTSVRGKRSLDFAGVGSMTQAAAIAQGAIDAEYGPGFEWQMRPVNTREELFALQ